MKLSIKNILYKEGLWLENGFTNLKKEMHL